MGSAPKSPARPAVPYLARDRVEALGAARAEDHPRTALGRQTRSRLADPAACSGDGHDFALGAGHLDPFVWALPDEQAHTPLFR